MKSSEIRRSFLRFFEERDHTIVPSMSLVPGGDETLLFTNSGMVQFKDVFLGTGSRPYSRAVDSQKCMRVAGKHNDLDDVGRDDSHHTFFEMLGNWSFGDYYKKEAIGWAWKLLTELWGLPKDKLYATCFEDELGEIPRDDEAANHWRDQPGFDPSHVLFFGRKENFWEMADTGPCGPDSEIHLDRGSKYCTSDTPGHVCEVNGDCGRFLELWNLVFIQYNRSSPKELAPLPAKHVDTGLGFDRIVSVLQDVDSNYKTDLFTPILETIQRSANHSSSEVNEHWTPYRVIADHSRAATFLIADGVVPGNMGRNYITRMIVRRASLFGSKIGFEEPFLAPIAATVIEEYGDAYPELVENQEAILSTMTDEEIRFHRTVDSGIGQLHTQFANLKSQGGDLLTGEKAFDLYATYGLPLEITRDLARESGFSVDEEGFTQAMNSHRIRSQTDDVQADPQVRGILGEMTTSSYQKLLNALVEDGELPTQAILYDPYGDLGWDTTILRMISAGKEVKTIKEGELAGIILPETHFYLAAGGQVSDTGSLVPLSSPDSLAKVFEVIEPVSGLIIHLVEIQSGRFQTKDKISATIDRTRRWDIMRNHTATHLLHTSLRKVLGKHARQAGSLVAPDRLRFDFTHPESMSPAQLQQVEAMVNEQILNNYRLSIAHASRDAAIEEGAMALFGETYGDTVRTVSIENGERISFELCGGTHVTETSTIGPFLILNEGSVAAGIRRIEAVTGREAMKLIKNRMTLIDRLAFQLDATPDSLESRISMLQEDWKRSESRLDSLLEIEAQNEFERIMRESTTDLEGFKLLTGIIPFASADRLRRLTDLFRQRESSGAVVLGSVLDNKPVLVAALSEDLVARGLHAGELVKAIAKEIGGSGGGKPTLAQAGGSDPERLSQALEEVPDWISSHMK